MVLETTRINISTVKTQYTQFDQWISPIQSLYYYNKTINNKNWQRKTVFLKKKTSKQRKRTSLCFFQWSLSSFFKKVKLLTCTTISTINRLWSRICWLTVLQNCSPQKFKNQKFGFKPPPQKNMMFSSSFRLAGF